MRNLGMICLVGFTFLVLGSAVLGDARDITLKKTSITAEQMRMRDGGELYQSLCAACHGNTGIGNGPAAGVLEPLPTDLTRLAEQAGGKYPSRAVFTKISGKHEALDPHAAMPSWEELFRHAFGGPGEARQRVYMLSQHVRSLQADPRSNN